MNCRSCHAPLPSPFLDLGLQPSGPELVDSGANPSEDRLLPLRVSACGRCGLVQLADPMAPTAGVGHGHATSVSSTLADHERRWAAELAGGLTDGSGPRRALDVSCGDGTLLRGIAAAAGSERVESLGFERDPGLAMAAQRSGIATTPAAFDTDAARRLVADGWLADLVIVSQALAHVDEPGVLIEAIAAVLAPGGRVAIEAHHLLGVIRDGQFDAVNHAHAIYPSLAALLQLLDVRGLEVTEARPVDAYGGSIRLIAGRSSSPRDMARDGDASGIDEMLSAERAAGLDKAAVLGEVGRRAVQLAADLRAFLVARRDEGARVVGYGAPARGSILLNLAGIGPDLLPFTVDRNPAKQGRVLAGCRIPVLDPSELDAASPDFVLVLPWTLLTEVRAQLVGLRRRGTNLVVAMPDLQVIET